MRVRQQASGIAARAPAGLVLLTVGLAAHAAAAQVLVPDSRIELHLDADSATSLRVSVPDAAAADLELVQLGGFVDLELRREPATAIDIRTEAGVEGRITAPLVAATAGPWDVTVRARKGRGAATVALSLSAPHPVTRQDELRSEAFNAYAQAEQSRRANFRETVVAIRAADTEQLTRDRYAAAVSAYRSADDGCGLRRAMIGLARMEVARGNHAQARAGATAALDARCEADPAERAQALKTIGMAAAYQGDFDESAAAAEAALDLYRQTGDLRYQGVVLGNLSEVYMQLGATDRALEAARGSLRAAEATADGQGIVFSRKSIAAIHLARGELAMALQDYRDMLAILAQTPYPMIEAETWNDLGIVYHRMASYDESLRAYATARRVWRRMHNRGGEADTLINRAQTLLEQGRASAALADYRKALAIARADGLQRTEAEALRGLGLRSLALHRTGEARSYLADSLRVARATRSVAAESYALRALGEVDYAQGHASDALRDDERALRLVRAAADRDGEAATLAQFARHAAAAGDLDAARQYIGDAIRIIELQRGQINDPSLRTSFFASMRAYSDAQIDILMRLDQREPGRGHALAALAAAESARARSLLDMFAERSIDPVRDRPAGIADAERRAEERLRIAAASLGRLDPAAPIDRRQALVAAVDAASHALDEARGRSRSTNPRYAALLLPAAVDIDAARERLIPGGTAIVEYWLGERQSFVWIVTADAVRVVRLARRAAIAAAATGLAMQLRVPRRDPGTQGFAALAAEDERQLRSIDAAAARLAAALSTDKVLHDLPPRVMIVADGEIQTVPFAILPYGTADGVRFGADHDIGYLPSITTLAWLRRPAPAAAPAPAVAVFAAPVLGPAGSTGAEPGPAELPYARQEAESIAALLPPERVWLSLGTEASRASALRADWQRYSIVHFATHASIDRARPELSGILLSTVDAAGHAQDGLLRMNDIYNLGMPVDLVVLSGCETAAGRAVESEGVFSLSRAFLYAGARRVLASLWPIEDRATASFMRAFYGALLVEHMPPAVALRRAQQQIARDGRWSSPYYWGGFVLQGDMD